MKITKDKKKHFVVGFLIALVGCFIAYFLLGMKENPMVLGSGIAILAGLAKELVWDKWMGKGTPSQMDFLFTLIGAILGGGLFQFVIYTFIV
jgi:hypothetical protein